MTETSAFGVVSATAASAGSFVCSNVHSTGLDKCFYGFVVVAHLAPIQAIDFGTFTFISDMFIASPRVDRSTTPLPGHSWNTYGHTLFLIFAYFDVEDDLFDPLLASQLTKGYLITRADERLSASGISICINICLGFGDVAWGWSMLASFL
ncbi:pentatricopeptide repeat-containing protein [Corchorus olitorius]|uniref:Pentatricopeptide repeat-containing protein n=1 Tax=Corchorus olitorius TaxID=93759 RepID=A0A1R3KU17_9ROSI|nr:pentatricopeptide repeat-containing protein [Corchorus olitorius]